MANNLKKYKNGNWVFVTDEYPVKVGGLPEEIEMLPFYTEENGEFYAEYGKAFDSVTVNVPTPYFPNNVYIKEIWSGGETTDLEIASVEEIGFTPQAGILFTGITDPYYQTGSFPMFQGFAAHGTTNFMFSTMVTGNISDPTNPTISTVFDNGSNASSSSKCVIGFNSDGTKIIGRYSATNHLMSGVRYIAIFMTDF